MIALAFFSVAEKFCSGQSSILKKKRTGLLHYERIVEITVSKTPVLVCSGLSDKLSETGSLTISVLSGGKANK